MSTATPDLRTEDLPAANRPGPRALLTLVGAEARMVARDTAGLIVPFGLPLLILLMSASQVTADGPDGVPVLERYVLPLVIAMIIGFIGVVNMPSFLAYYRRAGILRRLAVTPASPWLVLLAQAIVSLLQLVVGLAIALAAAVLVFDAGAPADPLLTLAMLALAVLGLYAVGMVVAALAPTPGSAVALSLVAFLGLGALGGMFGGRDVLPGALADVSGWLPFGAAVDAIGAAWVGATVPTEALIGLGVTAIGGYLIAAAFFRWE